MRVIARVTPPSEFQARVKNVHGSCREKAPPGEDRFLVVTHSARPAIARVKQKIMPP